MSDLILYNTEPLIYENTATTGVTGSLTQNNGLMYLYTGEDALVHYPQRLNDFGDRAEYLRFYTFYAPANAPERMKGPWGASGNGKQVQGDSEFINLHIGDQISVNYDLSVSGKIRNGWKPNATPSHVAFQAYILSDLVTGPSYSSGPMYLASAGPAYGVTYLFDGSTGVTGSDHTTGYFDAANSAWSASVTGATASFSLANTGNYKCFVDYDGNGYNYSTALPITSFDNWQDIRFTMYVRTVFGSPTMFAFEGWWASPYGDRRKNWSGDALLGPIGSSFITDL